MDRSLMFADVRTFIFCDETKFYINNGDAEDAFFYVGIAVPKPIVHLVSQDLKKLFTIDFPLKTHFHSTTIFREKRPRELLMEAITDLLIKYRLKCFCFKYLNRVLFEPTKHLNYLNDDDIINFNNADFQALFYFVTSLNTYIRDEKPGLIKARAYMFFDRFVYGSADTEAFTFKDNDFLIKGMTHVENTLVDLLALPDFFGYIFRRSKISINKAELGDVSLESSKVTINSFSNLLKLSQLKLFHFLDMDKWIDDIEVLLGTK